MRNLPRHPKVADRPAIGVAWAAEVAAARQFRAAGDATAEWRHLERAHILSQPVAKLHLRTHLAMLGHGIRRGDRREVTGQLVRLLVAGPGSAFRRYPLGNTGGADVRATSVMPVPGDLQALLTGGSVTAPSSAAPTSTREPGQASAPECSAPTDG